MFSLKNLIRRRPDEAAEAIARAYENVFGSEDGEIVLEDLAYRFHLLSSTAYHDDMKIAEGERNVLLYILGVINRQNFASIQELAEEVSGWPQQEI